MVCSERESAVSSAARTSREVEGRWGAGEEEELELEVVLVS